MYAKFSGVQQATDQPLHRYWTDQLVQCSEFNKPLLSHLVNIILLLASFSLDKKVQTMRLPAVKFVIPVTSALCRSCGFMKNITLQYRIPPAIQNLNCNEMARPAMEGSLM